mgnify:CR=1 FL=1
MKIKRDSKISEESKIHLDDLFADYGIRMTGQRKIIAQLLAKADDHPDVEELHRRANSVDSKISIATVYRAVRLFEDVGILERHDFRDGRARYEMASEEHHDHLINLRTGEVVEFQNDKIEELQREIAKELGFRLADHRLELYGIPSDEDKDS